MFVHLRVGVAADHDTRASEGQVAAVVAPHLALSAVTPAAVELDGDAMFWPEAVDFEAADPDVHLRTRYAGGLDQEQERPLERAVGPSEVWPVDGEGLLERRSPGLATAGDRVDVIELDESVVVGFG